jgi:hypothetical protein
MAVEGLPELCAAAVVDGGEALAAHRASCAQCQARDDAGEQEALFEVETPTPARTQVMY